MSKKREKLKSVDPILSQDTLRLSPVGAAMLLGDLEQRIMQVMWAATKPLTARDLHLRVARSHDVAYITCVTVSNRLVQKRFLHREKRDDLFHYQPTLSKSEFMVRASRHVVSRILGLGSRAVASSLVDVLAERDPEQLAELGRLVRRKIKDGDGGQGR